MIHNDMGASNTIITPCTHDGVQTYVMHVTLTAEIGKKVEKATEVVVPLHPTTCQELGNLPHHPPVIQDDSA